MKTSNQSQSDKLKNQSPEQDVNENTNEMKNKNQSNSNKNSPGKSDYKSNKGTGMSSEAGANQTEESWQGTGGSKPTSMQNDTDNTNQSSRGSGNMSNVGTSRRNMGNTSDKGLGNSQGSDNLNTDNIKNQSDQQRRSSMGDGTPEMREKNMKNTKLPNEEMNDVDWGSSKNE